MGHTPLSKRGINLKRLTDKMRKFVTEYPKDFNGKRAVIDAGYSKNGADVMASRLLKHPLVQKALGKAMLHTVETAELTREEIVAQVDAAATFDPLPLCNKKGQIEIEDFNKLPAHVRKVVSIKTTRNSSGDVLQTIEVKQADRLKAAELSMRHRGMLRDKLEVTPKLSAVDWDTIYRDHEGDAGSVEERLRIEEDKGG